ncbi:MAG: peptide MFS transporter [Deltaproteobacteria bacterium]|nr:peptide MFS transporter [Deltaproteobacteria bacterium]
MSTASTSEAPVTEVVKKGHPKGLYLLFATEMWERMSYYGMRALLVLYMTGAADHGGFHWSRATALKIYGTYTALVYLTPLAGGYIADRYLGQRRAVVLGGFLMMIGHFLMAVPGVTAFFAALTFLIVGNGFFKPNISTMVGGLYPPGDARRDGAFTIFYMGINLGAFLSPLVCGTLGEKLGWHWGFGSAGVGMGLGLITFLALNKRLLGGVGLAPAPRGAQKLGPPGEGDYRAPGEVQTETAKLTHVERDRLGVIFALAFFNIFFWAAFEQAGGLMTLYTDTKVDRHLFGLVVPTTWFQSINPMFIVLMGPLFSILWVRLAKARREPSTPAKLGIGLLLLSFGFVLMLGASKQTADGGQAAMFWVVGAYFFHTVGELCLSPVGLSAVSKLAPARFASLMMGVWLLSSFVANYLAGLIGGYSERLGEFTLFATIVGVTAAAGAVLIALSPVITKRMHNPPLVVPTA